MDIGAQIPWLPDETLFSWCSRYHRVSVNGRSAATCLQLFGTTRGGTAHDFPSRIGVLAARASGSLGDAAAIASRRTLLAFYAPFRSADMVEQAVRRMCGDGIDALKFQLGLLTSGLGAAHPLKACHECIANDLRQLGVAYWRLPHQFPTTWYCLEHRIPLQVSPLKLNVNGRFDWGLPTDAQLMPWWTTGGSLPPAAVGDTALRLAEMGTSAATCTRGHLAQPSRWAAAFRLGMERRHWTGGSGRFSWKSMESALQHHSRQLSCLPPFAMQLDASSARSQLTRIASARSTVHPLRGLAWAALVFEDWKAFSSALCTEPAAPLPSPREQQSTGSDGLDPRAAEAVSTLLQGDRSMTSVARQFEVDVSTVVAWAARAGLAAQRRPKSLDEARWLKAIDLLSKGAGKAEVASAINMSEVTVTRTLRSVPGLQVAWHEARQDRARTSARQAWLAMSKLGEFIGIAAARRAEPAAYAWLYRNDRVWLTEQTALLATNRHGGNCVEAKRRLADERYARGLERALQHAFAGSTPSLFQPSDWSVLAPGLRRVLLHPRSWPLTVKVLRTALGASSSPYQSPLHAAIGDGRAEPAS